MSGERDRERHEASGPAGPGFATSVLHGGSDPGEGERSPSRADGGSRPHTAALHQSSAFTFPDAASAREAFRAEASSGGEPAWIYSRLGNPTVRALERRLAALEAHPVPRSAGADASPSPEVPDPDDVDACFFASGMGAISALALSHAADGGRIVCQRGIYGTTEHLMDRLESWGARVTGVPVGDDEALIEAVASGPVDLVYVESPANPLLQTTDLAAVAEAVSRAGAALAVDATFATPRLTRPLAWGADFVIHSTTKFLSGQGAALGGVVVGDASAVRGALRDTRRDLGAAPDPFAAWLTLLGVETLDVRVERASANTDRLASVLSEHPAVKRVYVADRSRAPRGQLLGTVPMLSFEVEGGSEAAGRVMDRLRVCTLAPSLGTADTLIQHPDTMSHAVVPEERRRALGIGPGLLRVSVGIEDGHDLEEDFVRALDGAAG